MQADLIGSGWSFPMGVNGTGGIATSTGSANIERAMRLILATYPGERPMRPLFGSRLRDFQFEAITPANATAIATEVTQSIARCEPRARVSNVEVVPVIGEVGMFHLDIRYTISEESHERNLVVPFYAIPEE